MEGNHGKDGRALNGWANPSYTATEGENGGGGETGPYSAKTAAVMMEDHGPSVNLEEEGRLLKFVKRKLPILSWLPQYSLDWAVSDMIAGVTVGLTVIPQGIAYAIVAGLPPEYGLYSAFVGCFCYCILGSTKDITIGPTAIMAIMTGEVFHGVEETYGPFYAPLLAFFTGIIIFVCGNLQLGFLIDFISQPVIAGFTSGAALTIASGQIKSLLGLKIDSHIKSETGAGVVDYYVDIVNNIETCRYQDAILGISCAVILLALRALNRTGWFEEIQGEDSSSSRVQRFVNNRMSPKVLAVVRKAVWFLCTARNALVVVTMAVISGFLDPDISLCDEKQGGSRDNCVFTLTGEIPGGIPSPRLPDFSIPVNGTGTGLPEVEIPFSSMAGQLGSAFIIIPVIAILESIAIAKAFAGGKPVDASQEMVALGVCNIVGSMFRSMPTTGSFSRTAVNCASGVKTQMGGLYTGALVLICLAWLMPYCAFIPKAVLAAVIMTAVIFSVEHHVIHPIWDSKKIDLIPGFVCFFVALFYSLDYCIFAGTGVHLMIVLYTVARPKVEVELVTLRGLTYLSIRPDQGIVFPSVNYMRTRITKAGLQQGRARLPVVIDCKHVNQSDFTAAEGFKSMLADFASRSQPVYWLAANPEVAATLRVVVGTSFRDIQRVEEILPPGEEVLVEVTQDVQEDDGDRSSPDWEERSGQLLH